MFDTESERE